MPKVGYLIDAKGSLIDANWALLDAKCSLIDANCSLIAGSEYFPDYPNREDGLLVWAAIVDYVKDYVNLYYSSDSDVEKDTELQVQGLIPPGRLNTKTR
jgi:hypothetical protein